MWKPLNIVSTQDFVYINGHNFYGLHSMCIVVKIAKLNMEHCMWQAILLHDSRQKNDNLLEWSLDVLGWSLDVQNKI
jgi:hypothetical protein